ncbi:MAG: DUF2974 domain-containing protein [Oscillospiraceae bacterium]|nr:DUF2974 domain-containing protein [Oscillospiraceae bacterium]
MANIIEYAILNANKDFKTLPFSKIDGLIFAQLSYLNFDGIVPEIASQSQGVSLSEIAEHPDYNSLFPLPRTAENNKMLLNALAYSKRYGNILVNYYQNILDNENDIQFSAVTFITDPDHAYIAFRGTDSTIIGWKENFNMLFTSPVGSQKLSVPYVEKVASKFNGEITLIGHSKGGNLAIYSGVMCSDDIKGKISEILCFDNPGFTEEFINSEKYLKNERKIVKFVPEESMIGMILNNRGSYRVIKSHGIGFFQHDPFMWQIENNDFVSGSRVFTRALIIDDTFNDLVYGFEPHQRELFVESLFNIIAETNGQNAATFGQWAVNLKGNIPTMIDTLKDLDPDTRALMLKVLKHLFSTANGNMIATPKRILRGKIKKIPRIPAIEL